MHVMHVACLVCRYPIRYNSRLKGTECGHVFHEKCLNGWINRSRTCPACRGEVRCDMLRRVHLAARPSSSGVRAARLQKQLDEAMLLVRKATRDLAIQAAYFQHFDELLDELIHDLMVILEDLEDAAVENDIELITLHIKNNRLKADLERLTALVEGRGGERLVSNMGPPRSVSSMEDPIPANAIFEDAQPLASPGNRVEDNTAVTNDMDAEFLPTDA